MYMGAIDRGSAVTVSFAADSANEGAAHLLVGHGRTGGEAAAESATVAPGAGASVSLTADDKGILRVYVDVATEADGGMLEVKSGGGVLTARAIEGDTTWVYAVV